MMLLMMMLMMMKMKGLLVWCSGESEDMGKGEEDRRKVKKVKKKKIKKEKKGAGVDG